MYFTIMIWLSNPLVWIPKNEQYRKKGAENELLHTLMVWSFPEQNTQVIMCMATTTEYSTIQHFFTKTTYLFFDPFICLSAL